jgi:predicted metal-dependent hydrolase
MSESLVIDDLYFVLNRSNKRKTVGITIDRGGELIVNAPYDCPLEIIEQIALEKRFWIYTKLAEKELLAQNQSEKEFINGEGFYYLGRSYRLFLVSTKSPTPLRLYQGRFMLRSNEQDHARKHFIHWYTQHAELWLQRWVNLFSPRLGVAPSIIKIRDLGFRWGSCGSQGNLYFHWLTILLPPRIIEYIIVHELVHLHESHHNTQFWKYIERVLPDFGLRKQWLAENGSRFVL